MALKFFLENARPRRKENRAMTQLFFKPSRQRMDHWFDDFFEDFPFAITREERRGEFDPKIDVRENQTHFEIHAELPGMEEKDISVSMKEDVLTIKGEKKHKAEEKTETYHRTERSYGSFERAFRLPGAAEADAIKARYKNGVLSIHLPKIARKEDRTHTIEVQGA